MSKPRISIGLPVYNGDQYLTQALESLLGQTFGDFELLISDNASTDGTEAICRRFVRQDARIKYERLPQNIGAAPNFNRVFHLSSGEFFKWAAHDDICLPDFLSSCVAALDRDPAVVLCHSEVDLIDAQAKRIRRYAADIYDFDAAQPQARFRNLIFSDHMCIDVFGLIRRQVLAQTPLIGSYVASDRVLLAELGLRGRIHRSERMLFLSRDHSGRSINSINIRERAAWFDSALKGRLAMPFWRTWVEYCLTVHRVRLPLGSRVGCWAALLAWPIQNRALLWGDIGAAVRLRSRVCSLLGIPYKHCQRGQTSV